MRARRILRIAFAVIFVGGGISHVVLGRLTPESYRVYADTALLAPLADLWHSFVMPHIGGLTLLLAAFEIACGLGLLASGRTVRLAAGGILGFLVFVTVLGYGFPTESFLEDLLKNRIITALMALAVVPLLTGPPPPAVRHA